MDTKSHNTDVHRGYLRMSSGGGFTFENKDLNMAAIYIFSSSKLREVRYR